MIKFIKRLFEKDPDVLLIGSDYEGSIRFARSRKLGGRRVVDYRGDLLILQDDGTVRGSVWVKKWEAV